MNMYVGKEVSKRSNFCFYEIGGCEIWIQIVPYLLSIQIRWNNYEGPLFSLRRALNRELSKSAKIEDLRQNNLRSII
jgi:hypothetical protein